MRNIIIPIMTALSILPGCANINKYEGPDAAMVPNPCQTSVGTTPDGARYIAHIIINEVDNHFIGSGNVCPEKGYTYLIQPGVRKLTLISNFEFYNPPHMRTGIFVAPATLEPNKTYALKTLFDGTTIKSSIIDTSSGKTVGQGETTDVSMTRITNNNGALQALPFILKR